MGQVKLRQWRSGRCTEERHQQFQNSKGQRSRRENATKKEAPDDEEQEAQAKVVAAAHLVVDTPLQAGHLQPTVTAGLSVPLESCLRTSQQWRLQPGGAKTHVGQQTQQAGKAISHQLSTRTRAKAKQCKCVGKSVS